jgi:hypothetical protein
MERQQWIDLVACLFGFYLAFGIISVGFGVMFAGADGGKRAAHFYFGRSLSWTIEHIRALFVLVLATLWRVVLGIVRPLALHLWRGLRWFVTRERGWVRAPKARARPTPRQPRRWQIPPRLIASLQEFRDRYLTLQSIPFLLFLLCTTIAGLLLCVFLLYRVLGW